jgi:hypothetical protein
MSNKRERLGDGYFGARGMICSVSIWNRSSRVANIVPAKAQCSGVKWI